MSVGWTMYLAVLIIETKSNVFKRRIMIDFYVIKHIG